MRVYLQLSGWGRMWDSKAPAAQSTLLMGPQGD